MVLPKFAVALNQNENPITAAPLSINVSGDNVVVAGSSGLIVRIHKIFFIVGAAVNIIFKDGPNALTGAMPFTTNGTLTFDFDTHPWFETLSGNSFIMNLSTGSLVAGGLFYTQQP